MSKIQKALDAIRDRPYDGKEPRRQMSGHAQRNQSRVANTDLGPEAGDGLYTETVKPQQSVKISTAGLLASGILPGPEHSELIAQQFRRIKRPILRCAFDPKLVVGEQANLIMVSSALAGAGKTFCSFNLAANMAAETDYGSILVDADVLKPGLSRALGVEDRVGLVDYLADPSITAAEILVQTDIDDMIVVPAGRVREDATELLSSRRMKLLMTWLSEQFPYRAVVFDTPPLLLTNEAQALAQQVGQVVLVIESRISSQDSVSQAIALLDPDKPVNAILNKSRESSRGGYHGFEYGQYP